MSVRAIILTRAKRAIIKNINIKTDSFSFKDGLYVVTADAIANYTENGRVRGSEIVYFEGNPNPITDKGVDDSSSDFMDNLVLVNALKQTSQGPRVDLSGLGDVLANVTSYLSSPSNFIWLIFYGIIAYALITSFISGDLF